MLVVEVDVLEVLVLVELVLVEVVVVEVLVLVVDVLDVVEVVVVVDVEVVVLSVAVNPLHCKPSNRKYPCTVFVATVDVLKYSSPATGLVGSVVRLSSLPAKLEKEVIFLILNL